MSSPPLRMCYTHIPSILTFENGRFVGINAPLVNYFVEDANFSFTTIPGKTYGVLVDPEKRMYDGCIGSIQTNQSDVAIVQVAAPVYGPRVLQGPSLGYERISILSSYDERVDKVLLQDFLSVVSCFTTSVWVMIGAAILALILLLIRAQHICSYIAGHRPCSRHQNLQKRRKTWITKAVAFTVSRFLRQVSGYGFRRRATFVRLLILTTSLFFFWIHCFFFSLIKTELTVIPSPQTIESYDDLMKQKVLPTWFSALGDVDLFRYAPRSSIEKQVWDFAVKQASGDTTKVLVSLSSSDLFGVMKDFTSRKSVVLVDRMMLHVLRENMCAGLLQHRLIDHILTHVAIDAHSVEHMRVTAISSQMTVPLRSFVRRVVGLLEAGLVEENTKRTGLLFEEAPSDAMRACLSDQLVLKAPGVHPPGYLYYSKSVLICCLLLLISGIALFVEQIRRVIRKRRE